jgi:CYTH domain-containing protein
VVEKVRHIVPVGRHLWEVDVYEGLLAGVVVAEVELDHEDEVFERPSWVGDEVTGNPRWRKVNLLAERVGRLAG